MSNEMAPKSLKHKDDRHIQTRLDYMLIFRSEGKAKIIRTLESWTDSKIAEWYKGIADSKEQGAEPPTEDLWITMSYDQFSLFVYGTIQHDTIKQQVDELVTSKHIERRIHPVYPYGPPQYRLNRELVQKSLDELEIPGNLFDLLPMFVTPRKKRTPQEKYPQGGGKKQGRDPGKIPPPTGETSYPSNNTTKNTENTAKNQGTEEGQHEQQASANASPPAPDASEDYRPDFSANRKTDSYSQQPTEDTDGQEYPAHGSDSFAGSRDHRSGDMAARPAMANEHTAPASGEVSPAVAHDTDTHLQKTTTVNGADGGKRGGRKASQEKEPAPVFTAEGQKVHDAWCSIFKSPPRAAEKTIVCANELAPRLIPWCKDLKVPCKDLLDEIRKWEYATDPEYYRKRGVALCDIGRDFERWQSVKTEELEREVQTRTPMKKESTILESLRAQQQRFAQLTGGVQ